MALADALCTTPARRRWHHEREPAALMTGLLRGRPYSPSQIIYDLRQLRLTGLTWRIGRTYS
jgi:hypothetical protein